MMRTPTRPQLPNYLGKPLALWRVCVQKLKSVMPKGLYARALLIVILPMVILQTVVTYVFLNGIGNSSRISFRQHWFRISRRSWISMIPIRRTKTTRH